MIKHNNDLLGKAYVIFLLPTLNKNVRNEIRKGKKIYFWRTSQQQEIDLIEEAGGAYHLFEFKWNSKKQARFSKTFLRSYDVASKQTVHPANVEEYVL